jgi:hypothetical protein
MLLFRRQLQFAECDGFSAKKSAKTPNLPPRVQEADIGGKPCRARACRHLSSPICTSRQGSGRCS